MPRTVRRAEHGSTLPRVCRAIPGAHPTPPEPSLLSAMAALGSTQQTQPHQLTSLVPAPGLSATCGHLLGLQECVGLQHARGHSPRATNCQWGAKPVGEHRASFSRTDRPSEDFLGASRELNHQFPQRTILITHPSLVACSITFGINYLCPSPYSGPIWGESKVVSSCIIQVISPEIKIEIGCRGARGGSTSHQGIGEGPRGGDVWSES